MKARILLNLRRRAHMRPSHLNMRVQLFINRFNARNKE